MSSGGAPEWAGWLVLGGLVGGFGWLTWWLFFSPLQKRTEPARPTRRMLRARRALAGLVFASGASFVVGARWDELWHRLYGGFGNDFLWPPHLLMYGSLGLNAAFAVLGLGWALRGRGGIRERFRAEPLVGLLGLFAAYQLASIPSDLLWHTIIGPDLTAWSLPHVLLTLTSSATWLIGLGLTRSAQPPDGWRGLPPRDLTSLNGLALGFVTVISLMLLQLAVTEWEWITAPSQLQVLLDRPAWSYPVVVLTIGIATAHLALHATRRIGAATSVALATLLVQLAALAVDRSSLAPPVLGSHLLLLPPAIALDAWYAFDQAHHRLTGSLLYAAVFLVIGLPYARSVVGVPGLDEATALVASGVLGLGAAALVGLVSTDVGSWLASLGWRAEPSVVAARASGLGMR